MVWYGDVRFKQRTFDTFSVPENKLVTNVHKRLQNIFNISAVVKSTVSSCVHEFQVCETTPTSHGESRYKLPRAQLYCTCFCLSR